MPANVETMFSVRVVPWHKIGRIVDNNLNAREATDASGLNWTVTKQPIYIDATTLDTPNSPIVPRRVPKRFATVRSSDFAPLGVVGDRYTIIQNLEMMEFAETLVDSGEAQFTTAGSLDGGRRVWACLELQKEVTINGDEHVPYLVVSNTHDGSSGLQALITPVRVVCQNTLLMATVAAKARWSIRHTSGASGRIAEAKQALGLSYAYLDAFEAQVRQLMDTQLLSNEAAKLTTDVIPKPNRTPRQTELAYKQALDRWAQQVQNLGAVVAINLDDTAWGFVQGVNTYELWDAPKGKANTPEKAASRILQMRQPLTNRALALVG